MTQPQPTLSALTDTRLDPQANTLPDAVTNFTPVPTAARADGWTPERQRRFIETLAETGSVSLAARHVGMSRESAYRLRRRRDAQAFANAWEAALGAATQMLTDLAFERATQGVSVPVFHDGEQVGERRYYSDRLLIFLLKHHAPLRYGSLSGLTRFDARRADPLEPAIRALPLLLNRLLRPLRRKGGHGGRPKK